MSLKLYFHPLSSFCQKALIALYESDTPFEPHLVDLGDEALRSAFLKVWPIGKFPVLRDERRDRTIPESSLIIEYLHQHYPGPTPLLPDDADLALQVHLWDRFYDLHVNEPMQKISPIGDGRRAAMTRTAWSRRRRGCGPPTPSSTNRWRQGLGLLAMISLWQTAPPRRRFTTPTG